MNITTLRLRYTQFFIVCLLFFSLYASVQSLAGGISGLEDNLWGRQFLITSFTSLRLKLGDHVFLQALVGKQGWLEMTGNLIGYQNIIETPPESWKQTQQKLQKLYKELQKRNITLILIIAPDKATIYPDKLPDEIQKHKPRSILDEFAAYLHQHGPPVLLDLRPALIEARKKQDVYYKTDSHWNAYGGFVAYTEIMKELSKTYPELAPKSIEDFTITTTQPRLLGLSGVIGATNLLEPVIVFRPNNTDTDIDTKSGLVLNDDRIHLEIFTTPNEKSPSLLMYMDSFGQEIRGFSSAHFSKSTFIQNDSKYRDAVSLKAIDTIKPNIVILEFVERSFRSKFLYDFLDHFLSEKN